MSNILFFGFTDSQTLYLKNKISDHSFFHIPDNNDLYSKASFESWRTKHFSQLYTCSRHSLIDASQLLDRLPVSCVLAAIQLESRIFNFNVNNAILALRQRVVLILDQLSISSPDLVFLRTPPQTSFGLLLAAIAFERSIPVYFFDNSSPLSQILLKRFSHEIDSTVRVPDVSSLSDHTIRYPTDHLNKGIKSMRSRQLLSFSPSLVYSTLFFCFRSSGSLFIRFFRYLYSAFSSLLFRKQFNLINTGLYFSQFSGSLFYIKLAFSELSLIPLIFFYEILSLFHWSTRNVDMDRNSVLFLSSYQPERTSCPDSYIFNDPRACVFHAATLSPVIYKEHPTIFMRHRNILYRSGFWRSLPFYLDLLFGSSQSVLFCPTMVSTQKLAQRVSSVYTIASSFILENRNLIGDCSDNDVSSDFFCYTHNWYVDLPDVKSFTKSGNIYLPCSRSFSDLYYDYSSFISAPSDATMFSNSIIDLILSHLDFLLNHVS